MKKTKIMKKKVAIIIPVYNSSKFLKECIESVLLQTYKNIEIILINDGSTDDSLEIIKSYSKKDKRIRYCSIKNSGVSIARNTGLEMCESEKVIFVDSDDIITPNLVEILINKGENAEFVMCGYKVYDMNKNIERKYICPNFSGNIKEYCNRIIDFLTPPFLLGPCFKLFDRKIIEKWNIIFPIDISYGEDAEFVLTYLEHTKTIKCIDNIGYTYRQYDSETLSKKFRKDKMDIYYRINNHILSLLNINDVDGCLQEIYNRHIQNFVEYTKELIISKLKYDEKKKLFFNKGYSSCVLTYKEKAGLLSIAQRILLISLKNKIFFPAYCIFYLKEKF